MEIVELGNVLRNRRVAAGRTIASVATDAGLSVPYIANLENGRGNPTLAAVANLATALGARLVVELVDDDEPRRTEPERLPDSLVQFARGARFSTESTRLAKATRSPQSAVRERLLHAMAAMACLVARPLSELDWHRILDTAVLVTRE
ncbi:helix-turn-helix domain-containing protein [Phytohabitans sp. LJ34]|uniref:helix-turn-helix domain-containing protein n=1 Tax=Phytohabitans sp. LJ34 TaxID=3452217 RepID=UPI003F8AA98A